MRPSALKEYVAWLLFLEAILLPVLACLARIKNAPVHRQVDAMRQAGDLEVDVQEQVGVVGDVGADRQRGARLLEAAEPAAGPRGGNRVVGCRLLVEHLDRRLLVVGGDDARQLEDVRLLDRVERAVDQRDLAGREDAADDAGGGRAAGS